MWEYYAEVQFKFSVSIQIFHDGGAYHKEASPLICCANQWAVFYMRGTSVMKGLEILRNKSREIMFSEKFIIQNQMAGNTDFEETIF